MGCGAIVAKLEGYQQIAAGMKVSFLVLMVMFWLIFLRHQENHNGPKDETEFFRIGLLSADEVIECSASELVAQYVGQTGSKT